MILNMKQLSLIRDLTPKAKLSTNLTTRCHPIHRWYNFTAGFSPEFVSECIAEAGMGKNDVLIDPFAGLSTALVEAGFSGVQSVGFEAHPFFFDMSLAKLHPPTLDDLDHIVSVAQGVLPYGGELGNLWKDSALTYLCKLLPEPQLRLLASALLAEDQIRPDTHSAYRLVLSNVLEKAASSQTDGIYKAPTTLKKSIPYHKALDNVCKMVQEDIAVLPPSFKSSATLYLGSSEKMVPIKDSSCSLCVTSPPYLNNFDYAEMTRMELYYWRYASSWKEITEKVRRQLIVNTTTAPSEFKRNQESYVKTLSKDSLADLAPLVDALKQQRHNRAGKKDYFSLIYPYFSQMQSVFRELRRVLRPNSPLHVIVGDAALYGIHIQTERLLANLMQENGFHIVRIENLRSRGDRWILEKRAGASKPLGEFHIYGKRTVE